jgi:hypothetical protein
MSKANQKISSSENENYEQLKKFALQEGASLFGVAETSAVMDRFHSLSPKALQGLDRAISVAFHLSDRVLEDVVEGPTKLYFFHYQRVNMHLDELGLKINNFIQSRGWRPFRFLPLNSLIGRSNSPIYLINTWRCKRESGGSAGIIS